MSTPLETSIIKTLAYFDLLKFPLTKEELFRYLWQSPGISYQKFVEYLDALPTSTIETHCGFYFLAGSKANVETRRASTVPSDQKLKKALRAARLIRAVPFLRGIAITSSVALESAQPKSDIDFFIVAKAGRIWLVRLFTNLILRLFGLRVYGDKKQDRICLSFYLDTKHLDLAGWRIAPDDVRFAYLLDGMTPLYDEGGYFKRVQNVNSWLQKFLPNNHHASLIKGADTLSAPGRLWKKAWEKMWYGNYGDLLESEAKKIQQLKMKFSLKEKAALKDKRVIIEEGILKLHENDERGWFRQEWVSRVAAFMDQQQ